MYTQGFHPVLSKNLWFQLIKYEINSDTETLVKNRCDMYWKWYLIDEDWQNSWSGIIFSDENASIFDNAAANIFSIPISFCILCFNFSYKLYVMCHYWKSGWTVERTGEISHSNEAEVWWSRVNWKWMSKVT